MKLKQSGYNEEFPQIIDTWRYGEYVPEWLSDRARVSSIDSNTGNPQLDTVETTSGGFEVRNSTGDSVLFRTTSREDFICFGDNRVFILTPIQLSLLYNTENLI